MIAEGEAGVTKVLGAREEKGAIYAAAFQWMHQTGTEAFGLKNISEALREDLTRAQAVCNGPRQIMGFCKNTHTNMVEAFAKRWAKDEWAQLNESMAVEKAPSNYVPLSGDSLSTHCDPAVIELALQSQAGI